MSIKMPKFRRFMASILSDPMFNEDIDYLITEDGRVFAQQLYQREVVEQTPFWRAFYCQRAGGINEQKTFIQITLTLGQIPKRQL